MFKGIIIFFSSIFIVKSNHIKLLPNGLYTDNNPMCVGIGRRIFASNLEGYACIHQSLDYSQIAGVTDGQSIIESIVPGIAELELYEGEPHSERPNSCPESSFVRAILCNNTNFIPYPDCQGDISQIDDGLCNNQNNNEECGWDGGDCCIESCIGIGCPTTNNDCKDPLYTPRPTRAPTPAPTQKPTNSPTLSPTNSPTHNPTIAPTPTPTQNPTNSPTNSQIFNPTIAPIPPDIIPEPTPSPNNDFFDNLNPINHKYLWFIYGSILILIIIIILLCVYCRNKQSIRNNHSDIEIENIQKEYNNTNPFDHQDNIV